MRWQRCLVRGVNEGLGFREDGGGGLREVEKVRDVVRFAEEQGEEVGRWVRGCLGF